MKQLTLWMSAALLLSTGAAAQTAQQDYARQERMRQQSQADSQRFQQRQAQGHYDLYGKRSPSSAPSGGGSGGGYSGSGAVDSVGLLANSFARWSQQLNGSSSGLATVLRAEPRPPPYTRDQLLAAQREDWTAHAQAGVAKYQFEVGYALMHGKSGFAKDPVAAAGWLHKASAQGNHDAMVTLSRLLLSKTPGIPVDLGAAYDLREMLPLDRFDGPVERAAHLSQLAISGFVDEPASMYPRFARSALIQVEAGHPDGPSNLLDVVTYHNAKMGKDADALLANYFRAIGHKGDPFIAMAAALAARKQAFGLNEAQLDLPQLEAKAKSYPASARLASQIANAMKTYECLAKASTAERAACG